MARLLNLVPGDCIEVMTHDDYKIIAFIDKITDDRLYFKHYSGLKFSVSRNKIKTIQRAEGNDRTN